MKRTTIYSSIDRIGMGRAIDSTPTSDLLRELEEAGVPLPGEKEMVSLSRMLNKEIEKYRKAVLGQESAPTWYNVYAVLDQDGSGFITYDELTNTIRQQCQQTSKMVPTNTIKALWCSLDADRSNTLEKDEMGAFLRLGALVPIKRRAPPTLPRPKAVSAASSYEPHEAANEPEYLPERAYAGSKLAGPLDRIGMGRPIDCMPTSEILLELEQAGVSLPGQRELTDLSRMINVGLEKYRKTILGQESVPTWYNLMQVLDQDGGGFVTYDELLTTIRQKVVKTQKEVPTSIIKALWCSLDKECANKVEKAQLAAFLRRGSDALPRRRIPRPRPQYVIPPSAVPRPRPARPAPSAPPTASSSSERSAIDGCHYHGLIASSHRDLTPDPPLAATSGAPGSTTSPELSPHTSYTHVLSDVHTPSHTSVHSVSSIDVHSPFHTSAALATCNATSSLRSTSSPELLPPHHRSAPALTTARRIFQPNVADLIRLDKLRRQTEDRRTAVARMLVGAAASGMTITGRGRDSRGRATQSPHRSAPSHATQRMSTQARREGFNVSRPAQQIWQQAQVGGSTLKVAWDAARPGTREPARETLCGVGAQWPRPGTREGRREARLKSHTATEMSRRREKPDPEHARDRQAPDAVNLTKAPDADSGGELAAEVARLKQESKGLYQEYHSDNHAAFVAGLEKGIAMASRQG